MRRATLTGWFLRVISTAGAVALAAGCGTVATRSPTPSPAPTTAPLPVVISTATATLNPATPTPSELPVVVPSETDSPPLSAEGPWLLLTRVTHEGRTLWAASSDLTILNKLIDEPGVRYAIQPGATLAGGGYVAYVSQTSDEARDMTLKLLHLPDRRIETITPLIHDKEGQPPIDVSNIYTDLAWSPNGKRLAFTGQIDGPTMDVYSYDLESGTITRLSSGDNQAYDLQWSPDGAWVIHGAYDFIAMGGPQTIGLWAAHADGSGSVTLAKSGPPPNGFHGQIDEMGWLDSSHILLADYGSPPSTIKSVDITTGAVEDIVTTSYDGAAYSTPFNTFLLEDFLSDDPQQKLRLFHDGQMSSIPGYEITGTYWSNLYNAFIGTTRDSQLYMITPSGEVSELPIKGEWSPCCPPDILPAPDKTLWAWHSYSFYASSSDLWVGEPETAPTYIAGHSEDMLIERVTWSPDSQRLVMLTKHNGLWIANRPDFKPVKVLGDSESYFVGWIN